MNIKETFGYNLRRLRESAGMSQATLAMLVDKRQEAISRYESGKSFPNSETIADFLEILEANLWEFFLTKEEAEKIESVKYGE